MAYGYVTPTGGFTVEIWFKHSALPTWNEAIVNQQTQNKASHGQRRLISTADSSLSTSSFLLVNFG
jgi:hypothetical protein